MPLTPSQYLNYPNYNGQLSAPLFTPFSLLTLNNTLGMLPRGIPTTPPFSGNPIDTDKPQIIQAQSDDLCNPFAPGEHCVQTPFGKSIDSFITDSIFPYIKDAGLLLLALLLIAFGLYMLANATDTGKAVINVAKVAAVA
jgi:hypothetical protein